MQFLLQITLVSYIQLTVRPAVQRFLSALRLYPRQDGRKAADVHRDGTAHPRVSVLDVHRVQTLRHGAGDQQI